MLPPLHPTPRGHRNTTATGMNDHNNMPHCHLAPEPPLIGNYMPDRRPTWTSHKNQNTFRSTHGGLNKWRASLPPGTGMCFVVGSKADPSRHHHNLHHQQQLNKHPHHQFRNEIFTQSGKKRYFNIMWDPRIARGPNLIQFTAMQRAKCKRELDLNHSMQFRHNRKNHESISNQVRRVISPDVKIAKEQLTYETLAQFLTDQTEITTKDAAQSMEGDLPGWSNEPPPRPYKTGISAGIQTDQEAWKEETTEWIVKSLVEKIPEQAVLELAEESELAVVKGMRQRHEMVLLYRKWQKMKEDQWNEYVRVWNELRMGEIRDEASYLGDQQEQSVGVIAFSKNAINCCFLQTFEIMKLDGFISKDGVPHEELNAISGILDLNKLTDTSLERKQLAKTILDSSIASVAIHRFADHMNDEFGRPHGRWLSQAPRASDVQHDHDLQQYLEGRGTKEHGSDSIDSDHSFLNIFHYSKSKLKHASGRVLNEPHNNTNINPDEVGDELEGKIVLPKLVSAGKKSTTFADVIEVSGGEGEDGSADHHQNPSTADEEHDHEHGHADVSILYKRATRWSVLELDDHKAGGIQLVKGESRGNERASSKRGQSVDKKKGTSFGLSNKFGKSSTTANSRTSQARTKSLSGSTPSEPKPRPRS